MGLANPTPPPVPMKSTAPVSRGDAARVKMAGARAVVLTWTMVVVVGAKVIVVTSVMNFVTVTIEAMEFVMVTTVGVEVADSSIVGSEGSTDGKTTDAALDGAVVIAAGSEDGTLAGLEIVSAVDAALDVTTESAEEAADVELVNGVSIADVPLTSAAVELTTLLLLLLLLLTMLSDVVLSVADSWVEEAVADAVGSAEITFSDAEDVEAETEADV